ncbi:DUF4190 domain-containing protein [Streptomyces sp. NPDC090303]|uniref:DUF4190 domain-containing protein n=2 Tax=unclassified Streptomyces TaxID=2593676 RepID=UPI00381B6867
MEPSQPSQPTPPPSGGPQSGGGPGAGGWPAPGPYTSPGMPYGPPGPAPYGQPPHRSTNGFAVASLVAGLVCCVPPLGLVLGLVALPRIRKRDQNGKGLAIAGIALSVVSCLLLVAGLVSGGFRTAYESFKEGVDEASRSRSAFALRPGQCFTDHSKGEEYATDVRVVDCAGPHDGEVSGTFKVTGVAKWPGDDALEDIADERCEPINAAYAMDTWAIPRSVGLSYYQPSRESWRLGDREVTCAFTGDKPFSGSVRSDTTRLTLDQEHFLLSLNPIETVGYREPEEDPDEDFEANRQWARELLAAIDSARDGVRDRDWPGTSKPALAALGKELDTASKRWRAMTAATDAEAYWEGYEAAWDALPEDLGAEARTALGLTGTPPADEGTQA